MSTKRFELTLVERNTGDKPDFRPLTINKVEGDDLVELLSQFIMVIAVMQREWESKITEDDIPF